MATLTKRNIVVFKCSQVVVTGKWCFKNALNLTEKTQSGGGIKEANTNLKVA